MKVNVTRRELFAQLPREMQLAMIAGMEDLPERFTLEVVPDPTPDDQERLRKQHRGAYTVLTPIEWDLFSDLVLKGDRGAYVHELSRYLRTTGSFGYANTCNNVAVHVKSLRAKFARHGLPYAIVTMRKSNVRAGGYRLAML